MTNVHRPLTSGEILDHSFDLYRRNFAVLFGMTLLPQIPIVLFWLIAPAFVRFGGAGTMDVAALLITPYSGVVFLMLMGALAHATAQIYGGEQPTIGDSLKRGLRRWFTVAVIAFLVWFGIVFGLLFFVFPGLLLMSMWFGAVPAAVVENRGPIDSLGRSRRLSRGARMQILGVTLVAWLITFLPALALWAIAGVSPQGREALTGSGAADAAWVTGLLQAGSTLVGALTWPFLMIVTTLLFFDRRARTEAPDLEEAFSRLQQPSA